MSKKTHIVKPLPKYMAAITPSSLNDLKTNPATGENIHWTSDPSYELPIKLGCDPTCMSSRPPVTILDQFNATVQRFPNRLALRVKRGGSWIDWTWAAYQRDVHLFAKACIQIGLQPHQSVSIIGFNSPEWLIANIGAIHAGGHSAGIYTTNNVESAWYVAHHSDSAVVVAEDTHQVEKFMACRDRLPLLKAIVQYTGTVTADHKTAGVYSWNEFLALAKTTDDSLLAERMQAQRPGHCSTLIYTSGTTGNPKGVMLSHDNFTWTSAAALAEIDVNEEDRSVSYLPLSHVAAQLLDIYLPMLIGSSLTFAQPDALKGSLVDTLQEVRPTFFFGVPRVWEKIEEKMREVGASNGYLKQTLGNWAKSVGLEGNYARLENRPLPWGWTLADRVVFSNVKKGLGLDQSRFRATSAAPISRETLEYFMSLDLPLLEIYGMSESSGPHTINFPHHQCLFSVGTVFPGAYMKLDDVDDEGNGEVCLWGRHVFMGYLRNPKDTASTITPDGYLHSGDLGKCDKNGFLTITGRIKELLITAGGENVAPVPIEDNIKAQLPFISNAVVIGDKRKFLISLLTFKTNPDSQGNPTNVLTDVAVNVLNERGADISRGVTVQQAMANQKIRQIIQSGLDLANKKAVSAAQVVQKWALLENDFVLDDELTPTMKLKRRVVMQKYHDLIDALYSDVPAKL